MIKFGRWLLVEKKSAKEVLVRCECGTEKTVQWGSLVRGSSKSCGCLRKKLVGERRTTHGMTESREYRAWRHMKERCYNPKTLGYQYWGGKGIKVCPQWEHSFETFLADMGPRPEGCSLDRKDNSRDYEPGNCRWATKKDQMNNQTKNVMVEHAGRVQSIAQWADELGVPYHTLYKRIMVYGWTVEQAFTGKK